MSEASDAFYEFFGVVFFANEEYGVSDDFDVEAEGFVYAASEAEKVSERTATGKEINVQSGIFWLLFKYGVCDGCHWVRVIHCSVQVAEVLATVLFETLWSSQRSPLRRFS